MNREDDFIKGLVGGISDELATKIDIYLANVDLSDKQKTDLIEMLNESFIEGVSLEETIDNIRPKRKNKK